MLSGEDLAIIDFIHIYLMVIDVGRVTVLLTSNVG